jgi:hypothetical protein
MFPGGSRLFSLPGAPGYRRTSAHDTCSSASKQEDVCIVYHFMPNRNSEQRLNKGEKNLEQTLHTVACPRQKVPRVWSPGDPSELTENVGST